MSLEAPAGEELVPIGGQESGGSAVELPRGGAPAAEGAPEGHPRVRRFRFAHVAGLLAAVAISVGIVIFREELLALAGFGYAGLFVVGAIGSATVILPMPGLVLVFAAGASLSPVLSGLAYGTGAALGELTGYLAGFGGSGVVESSAGYARIRDYVKRWGAWVILALSIIPNPVFDIVGIAAGALRIPVWQFIAAAWAGNVIKAILVALAGAGAMGVVGPLIRDLLAR